MPRVQTIRAINTMPWAWSGPLGRAVIDGNTEVLDRGGSVTRLFLLTQDVTRERFDSGLVEAHDFVLKSISARTNVTNGSRYKSRCICPGGGN